MKITRARSACLLAALGLLCGPALADDRADYYRRAAARDVELFQSLDRDADGVVTRAEATGDLILGPRFADVDINRDGNMTRDELRAYISQHYGVEVPAAPGIAAR